MPPYNTTHNYGADVPASTLAPRPHTSLANGFVAQVTKGTTLLVGDLRSRRSHNPTSTPNPTPNTKSVCGDACVLYFQGFPFFSLLGPCFTSFLIIFIGYYFIFVPESRSTKDCDWCVHTICMLHFQMTSLLLDYNKDKLTQQPLTCLPRLANFYFISAIKLMYNSHDPGFVWFILTHNKKTYTYQFKQYAWTHMILLTVFAQSSFMVANIFEGMFRAFDKLHTSSMLCLYMFLLPASLIVINDIAAYLFGFFLNRTPLIKLSPKKTWEGFIGASVTTIIFAFLLANVMGRFQWFTCPRKDLSTGWLQCDPGPMFRPERYYLGDWVPHW
ncbi:hypothetical protein VPH35_005775 [Triticum aestivum]